MAAINYAVEYSRELAQAYPYVLNFGALYATPNNGRYRWVNARTIEIPNLSTTGRVPANRDQIGSASRNYDNAWESKTLSNQRMWTTLVHPQDIDQTNMAVSIRNITQVMNEEKKFPEMDAYTVSSIYQAWTALGNAADHTELNSSNVLSVFDSMMLAMDEARVPANGRILYCTNAVKTMIKSAATLVRNFSVQGGGSAVSRIVDRIDEVEIVGVPASLMYTQFDFAEGYIKADGADQINMMLIHPTAVITPVSYQFSQLDEPSAGSQGKYVYYEESFEDVFILNNHAGAIQFNTSVEYISGLTLTSTPHASTSGSTNITVDPASAGTGYKYYYKVAANPIDVAIGDTIATSGSDAWAELALSSGSATLASQTTGTVITVVHAKTSGLTVDKGGHVTITAKA